MSNLRTKRDAAANHSLGGGIVGNIRYFVGTVGTAVGAVLTLFQLQYMEGLVAIIYEKSSVFVGTVGTAVGTVVFL